jgi:hypothetical protein
MEDVTAVCLVNSFHKMSKEALPAPPNYDGLHTSIVWLYLIKPIGVERRNDSFGDDDLTIKGRLMHDKKIHFAVVPYELVKPHLQWIYVDTK